MAARAPSPKPPLKILSADLGLNVGYALIETGVEPKAASFRIPYRATQLGQINLYFVEKMEEIIGRAKPDVIARATRIIGRRNTPASIGVYFGLSMALDAMAVARRIRDVEISESDARRSFLGKVPRKSADIKRAIIEGCASRGWWAKDDHGCDAIVVGCHAMSILRPQGTHTFEPLFSRGK